MAAAVIVYLVLLCLHNISFGCHKLDVQHFAERARTVVGTERYVCLEPHCLVKVVGCVVEVQVHAFLLHYLTHLHCTIGDAVELALRGGRGEYNEDECQYGKYSFHVIGFFYI